MRSRSLLLWLSCLVLCCLPSAVGWAQVAGDNIIHDPSRIIKEGDRYYVYNTGLGGDDGIFFKYSDDLVTWNDPFNNARANAILRDAPAWVAGEVPANDGTFWAPSILEYNGEYRLYYSVSSFGSQDSAIGLATNTTLDFTSPSYEWVDQGPVLDSEPGFPYNAIDPAVFVDTDDRMWMTFGSFWNGIYITELDPADGKPISANPRFSSTHLARPASGSAIEAPYIHERDGYYYLFVNWGSCCNGVNSTYEIRVGRSTSPTGPFFDQEPEPANLAAGGGTLFLGTDGNRIGPGHMGIFSEDGADYFGYHFYDANSNGLPRYDIQQLYWTVDGWPLAASNIAAADLNGDSKIDEIDWLVFANFHLTDLSGLVPSIQARRGDLDGDGDNDFADFRRFETLFNAVQGPGALQVVIASIVVPEPSTGELLLFATSVFGGRRFGHVRK